MKAKQQIKCMFNAPALILHEAMHMFACMLSLTQIFSIRFEFKSNRAEIKYAAPKNKAANLFINAAPLLNFMCAALLCFFSSEFILLLAYLLITFETSFLSKKDFENIENFGKEQQFNWDI